MIINRAALFILITSVFAVSLHAAPPTDLSGKYVVLAGDRIEFPDATSGNSGGQAVTYLYSVVNAASASLRVDYPDTGRVRNVTLNFLPDGMANGYSEFDFLPPLPPLVRSGSFEIGVLDVSPPVIESSAPDSLTGFFIKFGRERFEFLTGENGRVFNPGNASYFTYSYTIVDEFSAEVVATFEDISRVAQFLLSFDEEGVPVSYIVVGDSDSEPEPFELVINRHLGDLTIGLSDTDQIGDDYFSHHGSRQTVKNRSKTMDPIVYPFMIENDGNVDSFLLYGAGSRRKFDVRYFTIGSGENVTAQIVAGVYQTSELGHRAKAGFLMEVTPKKSKAGIPVYAKAISSSNAQAKDMVRAFTKVKVRDGRGGDSDHDDRPGNGNAGGGNAHSNGKGKG